MNDPGLYVHVPFCSAVCPYCDFAVRRDHPSLHRRFVAGVLAEARARRGGMAPADTLYFGGGTPSVLGAGDFSALTGGLREAGALHADARIHLEANPEHLDRSRLDAWRAANVQFLSLGVQSFEDRRLKVLGRAHGGDSARRAVDRALAHGFRTVSIDLIYGLEGDDRDSWLRELDLALGLGAGHISSYALTIHEKTPFGLSERRGRSVSAGDDIEAELFLLTHERTRAAGWDDYEASNFARDRSHRSAHNMKYWRRIPYLGLGPSAHSFDGARRSWNIERFERWAEAIENGRPPILGEETLTGSEAAEETVMLGLRTAEGFDVREVDEHLPGFSETNRGRMAGWHAAGLVEHRIHRVMPGPRGMALADELAAELDYSSGHGT